MFGEMRHTTSYSGAIDAIGWLIFIEGFEEPPLTTGKLPSGKLRQLWKITIFNGKTHYK